MASSPARPGDLHDKSSTSLSTLLHASLQRPHPLPRCDDRRNSVPDPDSATIARHPRRCTAGNAESQFLEVIHIVSVFFGVP